MVSPLQPQCCCGFATATAELRPHYCGFATTLLRICDQLLRNCDHQNCNATAATATLRPKATKFDQKWHRHCSHSATADLRPLKTSRHCSEDDRAADLRPATAELRPHCCGFATSYCGFATTKIGIATAATATLRSIATNFDQKWHRHCSHSATAELRPLLRICDHTTADLRPKTSSTRA